MSDYISREDVLNASKIVYIEYLEADDDSYIEGEADFIPVVFKKDIEKIPAADVVEVIRCKDCRFFAPDTYGDAWCSAKSPGVSKGMCSPSGDSYCSDAERR